MSIPYQSLSISGLLTMDMHALNNEGSEGNHLQTRMVHILDQDGVPTVVNAISGDMFKHIQAEHLHGLAVERGLTLCEGCKRLSSNRINDDVEFLNEIGEKADSKEVLRKMLQHCVMDDLEGVLITANKNSTPRKSTVEFGWLVGLPEVTRTESYFHVKFASDRGEGSGSEDGSNRGQNIFYRPASSGKYALVLNAELSRVGFNDIVREHQISEVERGERVRMLLESILLSFVKPLGAHRSTQLPHLVNFEGVIAVSSTTLPAPTVSPLKDSYKEEIEDISNQLNRLGEGAIQTYPFTSQAEFTKIMVDLIEKVR